MGVDSFIKKFSGLTEEYKFYNGEVTLRYDPENHVYYLLTEDNRLVPQAGVTNTCHIMDKSNALIPWACKMMAQKLLDTTPYLITGDGKFTHQMPFEEYIGLVLAAKSAHKEKLEEAADVGHIAHAWIEEYIKERWINPVPGDHFKTFPENEKAASCCQAALSWMAAHNVRWIHTERKIYSRRYSFAGTMDGLAIVDSCDNPLCCKSQFKDRKAVIDWKSSNYLYLEYLFQTAAYQFAYEEETGEHVSDRWIIRLGKTDGDFEPWYLEPVTFQDDFSGFLYCLKLTKIRDKVEERMKYAKDVIKQARKAEKEAAKEEALKLKCKNADKYKGIRYPTCNGGNPCQACLDKYNERHKPVDNNEKV